MLANRRTKCGAITRSDPKLSPVHEEIGGKRLPTWRFSVNSPEERDAQHAMLAARDLFYDNETYPEKSVEEAAVFIGQHWPGIYKAMRAVRALPKYEREQFIAEAQAREAAMAA